MIASWISRVRFEVITTTGGAAARIVPSSGIVTWKSDSTSSRYASNGSSARSSSSISSTGATPSSRLQRLQQRPLQQESRGEDVVRELARVDAARGLGEADLDHLPRVVPLVDRARDVEAFVALQADRACASSAVGEHLGELGLADARLAFEEQRPPQLEREEHRGREAAVGDVVAARSSSAWRRIDAGAWTRERTAEVIACDEIAAGTAQCRSGQRIANASASRPHRARCASTLIEVRAVLGARVQIAVEPLRRRP